MKKNKILSDVELSFHELHGLEMHCRYLRNETIASILKAPAVTPQLLRRLLTGNTLPDQIKSTTDG